jgi:hypothetical protein
MGQIVNPSAEAMARLKEDLAGAPGKVARLYFEGFG